MQNASHEPMGNVDDYRDEDATNFPDSVTNRRTSDEDVLGKVRQDLQQPDDDDDISDDDGPGSPRRDRYFQTDEAAGLMYESDWEDGVQFHDGRDQQDEDIIVPKPLNDVSSAYFSNAVRPDTIRTDSAGELAGESQPRGTDMDDMVRGWQNDYEDGDDDDDLASSEMQRLRTSDEHSGLHRTTRHGSDSEAEQEFPREPGVPGQAWRSGDLRRPPKESNEIDRLEGTIL